ncbi:MAG TPA: TorF family putative porin [Gammaproteobacteria bacterium]
MKLNKKLLPLTGAAALALSGIAAPMTASADVSASMAFSNMYLWRGLNISSNFDEIEDNNGTTHFLGSGSPQISGSLDYTHASGFYAGAWGSNEGINGTETDLYAGFAGKLSEFSYNISYWWYLYPEAGGVGPETGLSDTDLSEVVLTLGYGPVSAGIYMGVDTELQGVDGSDYFYYTLGFNFLEKFNLTYGGWSFDEDGNNEYSHLTFTYSPTNELSFVVSKAMEDIEDSIEEDPLFQVTYKKSFDLAGK